MNTNQDNLPSVDAVFAAIKAAELWDKGWKISLTKCGRTLFQCIENNNAVFARDIISNRTTTRRVSTAPGENSVIALAQCFDEILAPREVDYSLAAEMAFECLGRPNFNAPIEMCADYSTAAARSGFGCGLDQLTFSVYLGALSYGFSEADAWGFVKDGLRFDNTRSLLDNTVDQVYQLYSWKTQDHVGEINGYYNYDPIREV